MTGGILFKKCGQICLFVNCGENSILILVSADGKITILPSELDFILSNFHYTSSENQRLSQCER